MTLDQAGMLETFITLPVVLFAGIVITWAMFRAAMGKPVPTIFD